MEIKTGKGKAIPTSTDDALAWDLSTQLVRDADSSGSLTASAGSWKLETKGDWLGKHIDSLSRAQLAKH